MFSHSLPRHVALLLALTAAACGGDDQPTRVQEPGEPAALVKVTEDVHEGVLGQTLEEPFVVRVEDADGVPVPGVEVTFRAEGDLGQEGSTSPATSITDSDGEASTEWTLAESVGEQVLEVSAPGVEAVTFEVQARSETGFWLSQHPKVAESVAWLAENNGQWEFSTWRFGRLLDLQNMTEAAQAGEFPFDPIPRNLNQVTSETLLAEPTASRLYLAHIAHAVHIETEGDVSWSLAGYSRTSLDLLLHGKTFYVHRGNFRGTGQAGWNTRAPHSTYTYPDSVWTFLNEEEILASSRYETIKRMVDWSREHLRHYTGRPSRSNNMDHWGYAGDPPVARVISGWEHPENGFGHYAAGCWGTTGFLQSVLRVANIPVAQITHTPGGHSLVHFPHENLYLSHGDDPYNQMSRSFLERTGGTPFPVDSLFLDQEQYDRWFGPDVPTEKKVDNVGRTPAELGLRHLSDYLLRVYCDDQEAARPHPESKLYEIYEDWYTVAELEARNTWQRLEEKVEGVGGCDYVVENYGA